MLSRKKWVKKVAILAMSACLLVGMTPAYADEACQDSGDAGYVVYAVTDEAVSQEEAVNDLLTETIPEEGLTEERTENENFEAEEPGFVPEIIEPETGSQSEEPVNDEESVAASTVPEGPTEGLPEEEPVAEGTTTEEIPAEGTPAEDSPSEEATAETASAEDTPIEETPAEEATAETTPVEVTPAEEVPVGEEPAEELPAEEAPAEETPAEETPAEETSAEEVPTEDTAPESEPVLTEPAEDTFDATTEAEEVTEPDVPEEPDSQEEPDTSEDLEIVTEEETIESLDAGSLSGDTVTYTGTSDYTLAYQVLTLVNQERAKEGLGALTMDRDLLEAAMLRAGEIAVSFSHTRPDGTSCFTACQKMSGENIAAGQTSAADVMNSWMNSAGHRANILTAGFQSIGIGCFIIDGTYYWAQCFGFGEADPVSSYSNTELTVDAVIGSNLLGKSEIRLLFQESAFRDGYSYQVTPYFCIDDEDDGTWVSIELDPAKLTWTSSDTSIATVSGKGVVSTRKPGTVTITAAKGSFTGTYQMAVVCNHTYSYTSIVNGQTTATCSKCHQKVNITVPTYYSLFWRNSTSDDGYYYSGLPLYNPVGSSLECWLNDMDGTEGFNYLVVDNSNPSVLSTPDRVEVSYFDTYSFKILKKGKVRLRLYADANPSLSMEVYMIFGDAYMWFSNDGADWYCYENGNAVDGWKKIDSKWYCFDYGHMKTGFVQYGGKYYYIDPSTGNFKTGLVKDGGKYYYFDPSTGAMKTGWLAAGGKYYYFSPLTGALQTGFVQIGSNYYYFSIYTGELLTGLVQNGSNYYYFNTSTGALQTGWVSDSGKYYYMDPYTGQMRFGWLQYQGYWFYLNPSTGAMVTGTQVINGRIYRFNAYGVCIG